VVEIRIIPHQTRWTDEFNRIGRTLRAALGNQALRTDHIGSTAVSGLAAKDIIDVQVTVRDLAAQDYRSTLAGLGYSWIVRITEDHAPPGFEAAPHEWRKLFFRGPEDERRINLHVREAGRANQRYALLFRDYLRADDLACGAYAQVKQALAELHPGDMDAYYAVKDPVCDIIIAAANRWAEQTGYEQGPPDF
jgi:GrpB-like predicted nucleotidyltransferase (UPF0157 family)